MNKDGCNDFWNKEKEQNKIKPFEPCDKCHNKVLVTKEIEPIDSSYFKDNTEQKCIVECSQCKEMYLSDYD